jgi:pimeloyl-ACP methyl ester carboxylesterase
MTGNHTNPWHHAGIERRFVDIDAGQVHLRTTRAKPAGDQPSLLMIHASPASSITLVDLMAGLADGRRCYAPDTLGFGDSAAPTKQQPEIEDYAESSCQVLDALDLDQVDLYGSHTGAHIAVELAIRNPERVRRLILDGIALFDPEDKRDLLNNYAPECHPDEFGSQLTWAWHFIRDQAIYFPYYRRDAEHLRGVNMVPTEVLHTITVEVLKALTTYHLGYRAAFRHADRERMQLVTHRTLVTADASDPLNVTLDIAGELVPNNVKRLGPSTEQPGYVEAKVELLDKFLRDD